MLCSFKESSNILQVLRRALKLAALATLCNMTVFDENKQACSKLRCVPRLVQLLESHHMDIAAMAVGTLAHLVLMDHNRLKTWRCGGVDKLRRIADKRIPKVSAIAEETIQILMAGPRIHPNESFLTTSGRRLTASEMRRAVQRLNAQDAYLSQVSLSTTAFQSATPLNAGIPCRSAQSARPATNTGRSSPDCSSTKIERCDFASLPQRPSTAMPNRRGVSLSWQGKDLNADVTDTDMATPLQAFQQPQPVETPPFQVPPPDPKKFCSPFMQRLSWQQEQNLVNRLAQRHGYSRLAAVGGTDDALTDLRVSRSRSARA